MHPDALLDVYHQEERELEQRLAYRLAAEDRSPSAPHRPGGGRAWVWAKGRLHS